MPPICVPTVGRRMFSVNILDLFEFSMISHQYDESMIWHQSYGHLHFNPMNFFHTKIMVQGLASISIEDQVCEGCIFGKQHRVPFPLGLAWRARGPLKLIHTDLCGLMKTPSLNGSRYFFHIVDELGLFLEREIKCI